jgi:2-polyprenyl-3-methyl-5-hydroxy-6-metoxy-1,4-benzoquinol methylase
MRVALLYPHALHSAIEERYARWQAQLFLRRAATWSEWIPYLPTEPLANVTAGVDADYCLVVTDEMLLAPRTILDSLATALVSHPDAVAAVPMTNAPDDASQQASGHEPYLTIRQLEEVAAQYSGSTNPPQTIVAKTDPGMFLARTDFARRCRRPAATALDGETIVVAPAAYVHRWTRLRSQGRSDLLPRVPVSARNILEFGCAEGLLGEEIKRRQKARVVGIEMDESAAAQARKRLDDVYCGDATELISIIDQKFDCIIGGDVLEHLDDPWSFLMGLRRVASDGAVLLLSIPNIANWAIVSDLLQNRFDYAYIAIACAGHLRFFSRETITDTLEIAGWSLVSIEQQAAITNSESARFMGQLAQAGLGGSATDLLAPGFYVLARNDERSRAR